MHASTYRSMAEQFTESGFQPPPGVKDLRSFRAWLHSDDFPEFIRASYIAGNIEVEMSPEEQETHGKLKVELVVTLGLLVRERRLGHLYTDRMALISNEADLSTEPDVMFCSWEARQSGRVQAAEWVEGSGRLVELIGAPDMVAEIVSRSSKKKDTKQLREAYYNAGIPEYWLIDARGDHIDFQLLVHGEREYQSVAPDADGYRRSSVFGVSFLLTRQLDPLGEFDYRLLQR